MWNGKKNKENRNGDEMKKSREEEEILLNKQRDELFDQIKEQNKIIEKQNKRIEGMQDQIEHYVKITEDLNAQMGSIHEIQSMKINTVNGIDDASETKSALVLWSEEFSGEYERNMKHHAIFFDMPILITFVLRFIYSVMIVIATSIKLNESSLSEKKKIRFITAAIMTAAIISEMLGVKVNKTTTLTYYVSAIGGIALWIVYTYIEFDTIRNSWIVGIIVIIAELLLVIQLIRGCFSKTLIASHLFGAMAFSFLLLGFYFQPNAFLLMFRVLSISQSILAVSGLTITRQTINQQILQEEHLHSAITDETTQSDNTNTVTSILDVFHQRLEFLESNQYPFSNKNKRRDLKRAQLSSDFYTMMVFSKWKAESYPLSYCRFGDSPIFFVGSHLGKSWLLGWLVFITQVLLATFTLLNEMQQDYQDTFLQIPIRVTNSVRVGQFVALILSLMTQTDVLESFDFLLLASWKSNKWQALIDRDESETRFLVWFGRIAIPQILKMLQGIVVLMTIFVVIIQSDDIVDLLKDFTALFIISQIDEIFFHMADNGYFGKTLFMETEEVKKTSITIERKSLYHLHIFFWVLFLSFFSSWVYVIYVQEQGLLIIQKYPKCNIEIFHPEIKDNKCDQVLGIGANVEDCGFEGGDCLVFNTLYPNCIDVKPFRIGDGLCDGSSYNTPECLADGGDCLNVNFPNCKLKNPAMVGNGQCDYDANNEACGFDDGDCDEFNSKYPNCKFDVPSLIGNGVCVSKANTPECGNDGGDCDAFNEKFPNCMVDFPEKLGDGMCDGREYNTKECGFDDGDCQKEEKKVEND